MGKEKTTTTTNTQAAPTPEETRLNQLDIQAREATQPEQIKAQLASLDLINRLLAGGSINDLPGYFAELGRGISPDVTSGIVKESLRDIGSQFQGLGMLDSGTMASVGARTAGDIRRATEEFNIGNKFNLLNLALSGQAQVQQPILAQAEMLGSRLAGLRSISGTSTTTSPNPFLKSFQTSLGSTFGSPKFSSGPFSFGG